MKRYRNLAVIAVVTTISLGTFFTKVAMSESKLPKFYLKTENGDSKYVKDLMISGGYDQGRSLSISTDGSEYKDNNSILSDLDSDYYELKKLDDLKKNERNFMRGKISSSQFYIDKDYAWYADVKGGKLGGTYEHKNNHFKLYIDGLDLQNKDRYKFKIDIPGEENYSYINVNDVQLIGKDLVVTTSQNKTNVIKDKNTNSNVYVDQNEQVMYRINVNQKKIVDRTVINKTAIDQNSHTEYQNSIGESDETVPSIYNVYKKVKLKDTVQSNGETTTEEISNEVVVFNLETGKEETLNLSNEQKEQVMQSNVILEKDNLYFITHGDKAISVLKYNLNDKKVVGEPVLISKVNSNNLSNYTIINGKLYIITNNIENPGKVNKEFIITDLANGQSVFEGKIEVKNSKGDPSKALKKLQIYDFKVK